MPASWRPPAIAEGEQSLRRGVAPKTLGPTRAAARAFGGTKLDEVRRRVGVSQAELGSRLDGSPATADRKGGQACTGSLLLSIGEAVLLLPLVVAVLLVVELLVERLGRAAEAAELAADRERALRYRLAIDHLGVLRTLIAPEHG